SSCASLHTIGASDALEQYSFLSEAVDSPARGRIFPRAEKSACGKIRKLFARSQLRGRLAYQWRYALKNLSYESELGCFGGSSLLVLASGFCDASTLLRKSVGRTSSGMPLM